MDITQDYLLEKAEHLLLDGKIKSKIPIQKRVAYIVSHGASYASNGYAIRTQNVAQALTSKGYETICFIKPGRPWNLSSDISVSTEEWVENVRYVHSGKGEYFDIGSSEEILDKEVAYFIRLFEIYRPEYVVGASDYNTSLPALIAARHLNLSFL